MNLNGLGKPVLFKDFTEKAVAYAICCCDSLLLETARQFSRTGLFGSCSGLLLIKT